MKNINTILAVVDDSNLSNQILKKSIELATQFDATVIVLHTIHIPFLNLALYSDDVPIDKDKIKENIDTLFESLNEEGQIKHHTLVYFGDPSERASLEANRDNVDFIIGGSNINFEKLLREVNKSILVVKENSREYNTIIIPTDLSEKSKEAINFLKTHFSTENLNMVYGYESIAMVTSMYDINYIEMIEYQRENKNIASNLLTEFEKEVAVDGELTDVAFSLAHGLLKYLNNKNPDLIVVASHSGKNELFIGSTSSYLAKESNNDLLIFC